MPQGIRQLVIRLLPGFAANGAVGAAGMQAAPGPRLRVGIGALDRGGNGDAVGGFGAPALWPLAALSQR